MLRCIVEEAPRQEQQKINRQPETRWLNGPKINGCLFAKEALYHVHHTLNLCVGQLGIHWKTQALSGSLLGDRKISGFVTQVGVTFLQV